MSNDTKIFSKHVRNTRFTTYYTVLHLYLKFCYTVGTGAEHILIPERRTNFDEMISSLTEQEKRKNVVTIITRVTHTLHFNHILQRERLPSAPQV